MIRFDDGASSYALGPRRGEEPGLPSEREARWVLARWLAGEPWRAQLQWFAAHEIRVDARTDDALVDRICALLGARGLVLSREERRCLQDPSACLEAAEALTTDFADMTGVTTEIGEGSASRSTSADSEEESTSHSIQFRAVSSESDDPIEGMRYRLVLPDGTVIEGETDEFGHTMRVATDQPESIELFWIMNESILTNEDDEPRNC